MDQTMLRAHCLWSTSLYLSMAWRHHLSLWAFGLLLTFFFFRADRTLKIWTRIVFLISTVLVVLVGTLAFIAEHLLSEDLQISKESALDQILRNGTFLESIPARLEVWLLSISSGIFLQGGLAFAAFLLGVRLARCNFLSSPVDKVANSRLIKRAYFSGYRFKLLLQRYFYETSKRRIHLRVSISSRFLLPLWLLHCFRCSMLDLFVS